MARGRGAAVPTPNAEADEAEVVPGSARRSKVQSAATAVAVLKLCDGKRTVEEIVEALAKDYSAPAEIIRADVLDLLQGLADKGYIKA